MITLLFLVAVVLLVGAGHFAAFTFDLSAVPGGATGVLALVVVVLLVTRRL